MAITANVLKVIQDPDATVVVVEYSDGVSVKVQKEYRLTSFTLDSFKGLVQSQINAFGQVSEVPQKIPLGVFDPKVTPTQAEVLRAQYIKDLSDLRQMDKALFLKIIKVDDADYLALKQKVIDDYIAEYLSLL